MARPLLLIILLFYLSVFSAFSLAPMEVQLPGKSVFDTVYPELRHDGTPAYSLNPSSAPGFPDASSVAVRCSLVARLFQPGRTKNFISPAQPERMDAPLQASELSILSACGDPEEA